MKFCDIVAVKDQPKAMVIPVINVPSVRHGID